MSDSIFERVRNVVQTVSVGDEVRFNDRTYPLTVEHIERPNNCIYVYLRGIRDGYYRIGICSSEDQAVIFGRQTGYHETGYPVFNSRSLQSISVVNTHQFQPGQVFETVDSTSSHRTLDVFDKKNDREYEVVRLTVDENENVIGRERILLDVIDYKKRIFDGDVVMYRNLPMKYRDTHRGMNCRISRFDETKGVSIWYELRETTFLSYEEFLFGDAQSRFVSVDPKTQVL